MHRRRSMLVLMAAGSLLVAACGGDDDAASTDPTVEATAVTASSVSSTDTSTGAPDSGDPTGTPSATTEPTADEAEAPDGPGLDVPFSSLDPDATFRFVTYSRPTRLDPHRAPSAIDLVYLAIGYDRLVHIAPDNSPVPGLATGWSFSDDGMVFEMTLREGVTFQDGTPFDADAVKANIERAKSLPDSTVKGELEIVESVDVVDPLTVRLHLTKPSASLPLVLSDRAGMMVSPAAFETDLDRAMAGTGMYRLVEYRPDDVAIFERNDDYWDPEAAGAARLELYYLADESARINGVLSGQFDAASITPTEIGQAESGGLVVDAGPTMAVFQVYLNKSLEPLQDTRVRQAMQHAINRDALVESVYQGYATPVVEPFPEGYFADDPEVDSNLFPYDPDRARELLAEAGYPDGFEFTGLVPPSGELQAEAIQAMLAEVGITMNPQRITGGEAANNFFAKEEGDALFAIWTGRPDPSMTTTLLFTSEGFSNPGDFSTPRVEELNAEALATVDEEARTPILQELSGEIAREALNLIVAIPDEIQVHTEEVANLEIWSSGKVEFRGVGLTSE